jgi:hypothetical protein
MCLDRFLEDLETEFEEILWRDNPERLRAERIRLVRVQTRHAHAALEHADQVAEKLYARIRGLEQLRSELAQRVEIYLHVGDRANAWHHALRLDSIHQQLGGLYQQASYQEQIRHKHEEKLTDLDEEFRALVHRARR